MIRSLTEHHVPDITTKQQSLFSCVSLFCAKQESVQKYLGNSMSLGIFLNPPWIQLISSIFYLSAFLICYLSMQMVQVIAQTKAQSRAQSWITCAIQTGIKRSDNILPFLSNKNKNLITEQQCQPFQLNVEMDVMLCFLSLSHSLSYFSFSHLVIFSPSPLKTARNGKLLKIIQAPIPASTKILLLL